MSDLVKQRELEQNKYRVALNLLVLLDVGLFPGKHAVAVEESKGFIAAIRDDAALNLQSITPPPPAPLSELPDRRATTPA